MLVPQTKIRVKAKARSREAAEFFLHFQESQTSYWITHLQVQPADKTVCKSAEPLIPISDRTSDTEAMILGYIAEHSLPLSLADSLKNLIQEASRDPQSLSGLSLSKQTASSKMNYGLAKTCTEEIVAKL